MALYAITGAGDLQKIEYIPHKREYDIWRGRMTDVEYYEVMEKLRAIFDKKEVETSSFVPGKDWYETGYSAIYEACNEDEQQAGYFFGLLMWEAAMRHEADWSFKKASETTLNHIKGTMYFKINR